MIRVAEINAFNFGSTGNIMYNIAKIASEKEICVKTFCPTARMTKKYQNADNILFGTIMERRGCERLARIIPMHDFLNIFATRELLRYLDEFKPDIIHFHNLHGDYVNLKMLFLYAKKNEIKVVWTFHDCWPFTGHCPYFTYVNCKKWIDKCHDCTQYKEYPKSYVDDSKILYEKKKRVFNSLSDCVIVTPSEWLKELVSKSFLAKYEIMVINNGIDLNKFKPSFYDINIRQKYNLENKFIILGVAYLWDRRKGLDRLIQISEKLDEKYQIIIVGEVSKDENLGNIIHISRTANQSELAELYSAANVFINPTYEDNFPTVNIEALACGTPVLTYNTGGSPESIDDKTGEIIDDDTVVEAIVRWCNRTKPVEQCVNRAKQYDANNRFEEYIQLYTRLIRK